MTKQACAVTLRTVTVTDFRVLGDTVTVLPWYGLYCRLRPQRDCGGAASRMVALIDGAVLVYALVG
eukprot:m.205485 g.205485  ORF g.205485 m.205485 type:complete len:66 (+) comp22956_c0_seq1:728-925(+)